MLDDMGQLLQIRVGCPGVGVGVRGRHLFTQAGTFSSDLFTLNL